MHQKIQKGEKKRIRPGEKRRARRGTMWRGCRSQGQKRGEMLERKREAEIRKRMKK